MNSNALFEKETNYNTSKVVCWDYNCMSFALNYFDDWLELGHFHRLPCDYSKEDLEEMALECAEEMEEYYALRRVESLSDLKENEYMIAMRLGGEDFHFMRRFTDGQWYHKRGSWPIVEISEKEVFAETWEHSVDPYSSTIYLFAVPLNYVVY